MPNGGVPTGEEGLEPGGGLEGEETVEGVGIEGSVIVTLGG